MATGIYTYDENAWSVTKEMKKDYDDNGYIVVKGLLDREELDNVLKVLDNKDVISNFGYAIPDGLGTNAKLVIWTHPGNDVTGMTARAEKVVDTCEKLVNYGELYHYHTKFIRKDAFDGGCHLWHQDYGYWYKNGCLFPDEMITVSIAIDKADRGNGALQILRGSHKCGRIDHAPVAGQTMGDMDRINEIKKICPLEYVEIDEGDALFFHANLIHTSAPNDSPRRRWALLHSYNTKTNDPVYIHHHAQYTPLHKVPNKAIRECRNYTDFSGKEFLDPKNDQTVKGKKDEAA